MKEGMSPVLKIWLVTALIIIGVLAVSFASLRIVIKNTAEAFNTQQLFLVRESARSIEEFIKNIEKSLQTTADILVANPQEKILASFVAHQQGLIQALFLATEKGEILQQYPRDVPEFGYPDVDIKKCISRASGQGKKIFISDVLCVRQGKEKNLSLILGVAVARTSYWMCCLVNFHEMKESFIYPVRSGKTGYAWMIDNKGVLLAHPNKEMEGRKAVDVLKDLWPEYSACNLETIIDREMTRGEEGKGEYTGWHIGEKKLTKKLIAYCPIHFNGVLWSIGVSAPYREAMAPLVESILGPLVFLVCFILIIISVAWLLVVQETRKLLVHQELAWSNEVFDGIADGISIIDRDYRVLMVNKAISQWHGKPQASFKGMQCYNVFQQGEALCHGCPAREAFETGQAAYRERVSTTLGGKKYYFYLTAFPLKDKSGNTVRVAECAKDVTNEMALQSELLQHERKSMIVKMSAQVAHEIRNPLGSLTLNIDLLEDEISGYGGVDASEAKNLIGTIKAETEGLHKVLKEYLECTRFPTIKPEKQDVNSIIEDLFGFLEESLRRKKIIFRTTLEYNLPMAYVDQDQIRRAFLNIVLNAVEAMGSGGTIEVATRFQERYIEIVFADSGVGIESSQIDKIFTPFFSTKSGGTGLGLSITQHIVAEHKGEILCESFSGDGARFMIRLPVWEENDASRQS
ncbi:MAG: ATP-binding protein [Pseudomonadota bacterium]